MDFRRIAAVVLLVAVAGLVLPAPGQAFALGDEPIGPPARDPGLFAQVLEWLQGMIARLAPSFSAAEGATITGSG